jgi:hypothetical protein
MNDRNRGRIPPNQLSIIAWGQILPPEPLGGVIRPGQERAN